EIGAAVVRTSTVEGGGATAACCAGPDTGGFADSGGSRDRPDEGEGRPSGEGGDETAGVGGAWRGGAGGGGPGGEGPGHLPTVLARFPAVLEMDVAQLGAHYCGTSAGCGRDPAVHAAGRQSADPPGFHRLPCGGYRLCRHHPRRGCHWICRAVPGRVDR